jgi:hypothetical protein
MQSALALPIAWGAEQVFRQLPEWNAYGVLPEIYTALSGGLTELANVEKHIHGGRLLELPKNIGYQNLWPMINFAGGATKLKCIYTFRNGTTGAESPIEFDAVGMANKPSCTTPYLVQVGEGSVGNEKKFAETAISAMGSNPGSRGDFERAQCYGELYDMDPKKAPDPTGYFPLVRGHEIWLTGQIGKRTKVANTPSGEVFRYDKPGGWDLFKTYTRMDARYTVRNFPIEKLGVETELQRRDPLAIQRLLLSLSHGVRNSEQDDYVSSWITTPDGRRFPRRSDGIINPVALYM